MKNRGFCRSVLFCLLFAFPISLFAQPSSFSYQGRLTDNAAAANGSYDIQFLLFDLAAGGIQIGSTLDRPAVQVADGIFTVQLDFGTDAFPGAARHLEIRIRPAGSADPHTTLVPRQPVNSAPYSVRSLNSMQAENAESLGGTAASEFVLTGDARLSDARDPLPGSGNYIQNTSNLQALSNFHISGFGRADSFNALTTYMLNGIPVLRGGSSANIFLGSSAGLANTTGNFNTFLGSSAGSKNTTGGSNTFVGALSGVDNTTGVFNTFVGMAAGLNNIDGLSNSYFGYDAGRSNTTGDNNSFFGYRAGRSNTSSGNSYFGYSAGASNADGSANAVFGNLAFTNATTGSSNAIFGFAAGNNSTGMNQNSFFGARAGLSNTSGSSNTFIGYDTGAANNAGGNNTLLGAGANTGTSNLNFATAIGAGSVVSTNNTIALGRANGSDQVVIPGHLGIGITEPARRLHIVDNNSNVLIGGLGCSSGFVGILFGSSPGNCLSYSLLGSGTDTMVNAPSGGNVFLRIANITRAALDSNGNLGIGTTSPTQRLHVAGSGFVSGNLTVNGTLNATLPAGSSNYIQNTSTPQASSNFNISGNGTIGGQLSVTGNGQFGGALRMSAGSATAPSFSFNGDSNTGIYRSLSDTLNFSTAGIERMRIRSGGQIFIGDFVGFAGSGNLFMVEGAGNALGGVAGFSEVVARFKRKDAAGHSAVSIDSLDGQDSILYLAKNGEAKWHIRNDSSMSDQFQIRSPDGVSALTISPGATALSTDTSLSGTLDVGGYMYLGHLSTPGETVTPLCRASTKIIVSCSSSSIRYKTNVTNFSPGLGLIRQLRPVSFNWKGSGLLDLGLVAEEVAEVEPLLATYRDDGEIEGVKYDRVGVVLVNAVKEQQEMIDRQAAELKELRNQVGEQQKAIDALRQLVCTSQPDAALCRLSGNDEDPAAQETEAPQPANNGRETPRPIANH
jgi:hypothetical protein